MNTDALKGKVWGPNNFSGVRWIPWGSLKYWLKHGKAYKVEGGTFGKGFWLTAEGRCITALLTHILFSQSGYVAVTFLQYIATKGCSEEPNQQVGSSADCKTVVWLGRLSESCMAVGAYSSYFVSICICISNGCSKQKWLVQDGKIHTVSLKSPWIKSQGRKWIQQFWPCL